MSDTNEASKYADEVCSDTRQQLLTNLDPTEPIRLQVVNLNYDGFLDIIRNSVDKLPAIVAEVQNLLSSFRRVLVLIRGQELPPAAGSLQVYNPSPEEIVTEGKIVQLAALGDGGYLRTLFTLLRENPEIFGLLLSFLKK